jgi:hypothetical protein
MEPNDELPGRQWIMWAGGITMNWAYNVCRRPYAVTVNYPLDRWFDFKGASIELTPAQPGVLTTFKVDHYGRLVKEERDDGTSYLYTYNYDGSICYKHGPDWTVKQLTVNLPLEENRVTFMYDHTPIQVQVVTRGRHNKVPYKYS